MDEGARFPRVPAKRGHYESFYLKTTEPGGGRSLWIRHTVHKRPGAEPNASIWFVLFDREEQRSGPPATKTTVSGREGLSVPANGWIRVADAEIGPGWAAGKIETDVLRASWELSFEGDADPCRYLPSDWLYEAPVPRTKFVAPYPAAHFSGLLTVDDQPIELGGWPGMIGHNWGSEHAERWVWLEGTALDGDPGAYFDAGAARVKAGPWTSLWIPSGMLVLDGRSHRLGGLGKIREARIEETPTSCSFVLPGDDVVVRGHVSAPPEAFVGWVYADPKGPEHNTLNCSAADLELTVERPALPPREIRLEAGAAYEIGMRETDHGIPVQPYSDG